ncbi:chondroitin AC/alginate lyase [Aspergillus pseudoustus]|uniref:Chondroitin AC/alginate lyase n=1 Tax=Aspergillus pseudoustus TaxID=1810923 RepID=A0ABR4IAU0_9EURO
MEPIHIAIILPLTRAWIHPGILETTADLERMKTLIESENEPWKTAYENFSADEYSSADYELAGPFEYVCRDKDSSLMKGMSQFADDSVAALQTALMYTITGERAYAEKSLEILNAWGGALSVVNGSDAQLAAALSGSNLVNAAEIIKATYIWADDDVATFSSMVTEILVPPASQYIPSEDVPRPFIANWGSAGEKFMLAAAVFTEDTELYDLAKTLILDSPCANLTGSISATGQSSESGRDQGHTQLGLGNYVEAFTTLLNQEDSTDWFTLYSNRLAAGLEYTAQVLLQGDSLPPYDETFVRCNASLLGGPWAEISSDAIRPIRPIWELGYAIYADDRVVDMPYTKELIALVTPDGQSPATAVADGSAWQTLRFRREGSGLSAKITG